MGPTPEAIATEQLHISIVEVLVMARRHMGHALAAGEGVQAWCRFQAELECKLPADSGVVYDRNLSPAANARFLAEAHGITTAADVEPDADGLRRPDAPPRVSVHDHDPQGERP